MNELNRALHANRLQHKEIERLREENQRYREALEMYANDKNWADNYYWVNFGYGAYIAEEALEEPES